MKMMIRGNNTPYTRYNDKDTVFDTVTFYVEKLGDLNRILFTCIKLYFIMTISNNFHTNTHQIEHTSTTVIKKAGVNLTQCKLTQ